jgi:hypothetical protein
MAFNRRGFAVALICGGSHEKFDHSFISGVHGFSFPVYRMPRRGKGKREKRVFLSWKTRKEDCTLEIKEWSNFSWLPPQIKATAKPLLLNAIDITEKLLRRIGREQQQLWSSAVNLVSQKRTPRPFDLKRKMKIEAKSKGMQRVSVPTCSPELVGVAKVRSEAAVILGPGTHKGTHKLMALRDGATFDCSQEVIQHNDQEKDRYNFARDYSNWPTTRSCSCQVSISFII